MANSLPKHFHKTLDNGMQIVVIPLANESGVITSDIYYKVGSQNEVLGKTGMAHMLEHLSFKSTKNLSEGEFDTIVKKGGGVNNASTGFDKTHYYIKTSTKNLPKTLELFSELMHNLLLKDDEFQKERDVVAEERRLRTDNSPMGYLYFRLFNTHFVYHPYHWLPIGFMEDILSWKIEDIRAFYESYYQPKNAILVVSGDIEPETVFNEAKKYFGKLENKKEIPNLQIVEPKVDGAKRVELHKESNKVDTIAIAYSIPNFAHEDQMALSVISQILSGGKSSRFDSELIDKKRQFNTIYAYNMELKDPGVFLIMGMLNEKTKPEIGEKSILTILDDIKKHGITKEELNRAKINMRAEFIFSLESSSSVANLFGDYYAMGDIQPLLDYEDKLDKITLDDIKKVANRYLNNNQSTTVILRKSK
ncbi:putative peptidase, M16 family [Sulfurovum sp. enrichment culture clone C5]|uniref:Putative peptidase, M16 family n=1 Tax=Sulfurovum sp. enrichment culture clone C5 TaxID=497650 RepID=A0A0S4XNR6_9BACT|nr:putative peptidase, M16 family [Sulfurovum sp. enrichment culture clone C5]